MFPSSNQIYEDVKTVPEGKELEQLPMTHTLPSMGRDTSQNNRKSMERYSERIDNQRKRNK